MKKSELHRMIKEELNAVVGKKPMKVLADYKEKIEILIDNMFDEIASSTLTISEREYERAIRNFQGEIDRAFSEIVGDLDL